MPKMGSGFLDRGRSRYDTTKGGNLSVVGIKKENYKLNWCQLCNLSGALAEKSDKGDWNWVGWV